MYSPCLQEGAIFSLWPYVIAKRVPVWPCTLWSRACRSSSVWRGGKKLLFPLPFSLFPFWKLFFISIAVLFPSECFLYVQGLIISCILFANGKMIRELLLFPPYLSVLIFPFFVYFIMRSEGELFWKYSSPFLLASLKVGCRFNRAALGVNFKVFFFKEVQVTVRVFILNQNFKRSPCQNFLICQDHKMARGTFPFLRGDF